MLELEARVGGLGTLVLFYLLKKKKKPNKYRTLIYKEYIIKA